MTPPIFTISIARQKFFSLFEIVTSHRGRIADGVDDPLADIRRDANALWETKLASFGK
jgi:hypothetical protein